MVWLWLAGLGVALADEDEPPPAGGVSAIGGTAGGVAGQSSRTDAPLPKWRLTYESMAAVRLNPLGLSLEVRPAVRRRLYASNSTIGRDNYADLAPTLTVTPAFVRSGASVGLQPVALLRLGARVEGIRYFGGFDQLQAWPDAEGAVWDDLTQDARGEAGLNYPAGGWLAAGEALLRAKVGEVAVLNQARLLYADLDLQGADTVFYEITYDALVADEGFLVINDLSAVWVPEALPLTAGARWSYVQALHPEAGEGEGAAAAAAMHRVGPLVAWRLRGAEGEGVGNLSVFSMAQWWLAHPYRTGQVSSAAVPYFVLGVSMSGDLVPWAP